MSKLYIFGIGGTGSRVLKSLTMLLTAGVECGADTIVPIIIDPDDAAADLTRTVETIKRYNSVRSKLDCSNATNNKFFKTEIRETVTGFRLPLQNTRDVKFKDYMSVSTMSKSNKAMINMLFSQRNLEADMKVGFKGNPNIGSVVLNQFADSNEFKAFANDFQQGDKIFIISSIFGGTGASGFPLLAKTLRSNKKLPNYALINKSQIGAISVLPYFGVKQDDSSSIDSGTFISKAKSALSYYQDNISNNNTVNALYYVADTIRNSYENCEGGAGQKNNAHFIELVSALSIIDFSLSDYSGDTTTHLEYGLSRDSHQVIFEDLGSDTQGTLQLPLTQFVLFSKYMKERDDASQTWRKDRKFDSAFFQSQFVKDILFVQNDFINWLTEMDSNQRRFSPFELSKTDKIFDIVKGGKPKRLMKLSSNYGLFDVFLNGQKINNAASKEHQYVELFYNSTEELVKRKINF